jgi:hypothetical protein
MDELEPRRDYSFSDSIDPEIERMIVVIENDCWSVREFEYFRIAIFSLIMRREKDKIPQSLASSECSIFEFFEYYRIANLYITKISLHQCWYREIFLDPRIIRKAIISYFSLEDESGRVWN